MSEATPEDESPVTSGEKGEQGIQGERGERGERGEGALVGTAEIMVTRLVKADGRRKWQVRLLTIGLVVALIAAALSGWGIMQNHATSAQVSTNTSALRQQSIVNCENNDDFRASQIAIWEQNYSLQAQESKATADLLTQLIAVLAQNNPAEIAQINSILSQSGKASSNEITAFLNVVKNDDAPKNCAALYAVPSHG